MARATSLAALLCLGIPPAATIVLEASGGAAAWRAAAPSSTHRRAVSCAAVAKSRSTAVRNVEWELDFYSRPVQGADGKKLWELLVTDSEGSFRHVEVAAARRTLPTDALACTHDSPLRAPTVCQPHSHLPHATTNLHKPRAYMYAKQAVPSNCVNSRELRTRVERLLDAAEARPTTIRFFRSQMKNMITIALGERGHTHYISGEACAGPHTCWGTTPTRPYSTARLPQASCPTSRASPAA